MRLKEKIYSFIQQPSPGWENELTEMLVQKKWEELKNYGINKPDEYCTARALYNSSLPAVPTSTSISNRNELESSKLEVPSFDILETFYNEHALEPLSESEVRGDEVSLKLDGAFAMLKLVEPLHSCICKLVKSIQVLRQEDEEIDISYSHPKIPFSIFVTVCKDASAISCLRVAESILHEAMHLKLSLIENVVPLINDSSTDLYYSPWRDEERPLQGVLHGIFVFKAVHGFYEEAKKFFLNKKVIIDFLERRLNDIEQELSKVQNFYKAQGLTQAGMVLVNNLLSR